MRGDSVFQAIRPFCSGNVRDAPKMSANVSGVFDCSGRSTTPVLEAQPSIDRQLPEAHRVLRERHVGAVRRVADHRRVVGDTRNGAPFAVAAAAGRRCGAVVCGTSPSRHSTPNLKSCGGADEVVLEPREVAAERCACRRVWRKFWNGASKRTRVTSSNAVVASPTLIAIGQRERRGQLPVAQRRAAGRRRSARVRTWPGRPSGGRPARTSASGRMNWLMSRLGMNFWPHS